MEPDARLSHFSDLPHGEKLRVGAFGAICLLAMVVAALVIHFYHCCQRRARARRARDEEAALGREVQRSAAQLTASQERTQELELELTAAHQRTNSLHAQVGELERRVHGICEEIRMERQKSSVVQRKLKLTEEARDLEKEAAQTSHAMYREALRMVEELQGAVGQAELQIEGAEVLGPDVHAAPVPLAVPAAEAAHESETDYFSAA